MLPWILLLCCADPRSAPTGGGDGGGEGTGDTAPAMPTTPVPVTVTVTLDDAPVEGATVAQGGHAARWTTDAHGRAWVAVDPMVEGDLVLMASHPEARIGGQAVEDLVLAGGGELLLALRRMATVDNEAYAYQDPGTPTRRDTTGQCAHCHVTINQDWHASPHRRSASNPVVQDLYAGTAAAWADPGSCEAAGGRWWTGIGPGTGEAAARCYLGLGALPALNEGCGVHAPCDGLAEETGDCAACHAPGLDGARQGRDLLEATGLAYDYGVHCDVCHKVEGVDLAAEGPGVAGRLRILRPGEVPTLPGIDEWAALTFGPYDDVVNPRMGSVARGHFQRAELCAACHEHEVQVRIPGQGLDPARWPEGRLPVLSTWSEWLAGPYGSDDGEDGVPCQGCHMPPDADVGNSADLGNLFALDPGVAGGWWRAPGAVRRHAFFGPRSEEQRLLDLAATLSLQAQEEGGQVRVTATVHNVGPGHALPTGEPMRHLLLLVAATCDGVALAPSGGLAVDDLGGALDSQDAGADWSRWPGAVVGDRIQVVAETGAWLDYEGHGPFGDGRFGPSDKGLPERVVVGGATVLDVDGEVVTLDGPLPAGDLAFRVEGGALPEEGDPPSTWAGTAGFSFGRVMVGADGSRLVPHFAAVDVVRDNRLLPGQAASSWHQFPACPTGAQVDARLLYRPWPVGLGRERGWAQAEQVIARATLVAP